MEKVRKTKLLAYFCSIISILIVWIFLSWAISAELILPSPLAVLKDFSVLIQSVKFWKSFFYTFLRVMASFSLSIIFGFITGYLCSESLFFKKFMEIPLTVIKSTPVIAVILITLFWFTSNWVPVFAGILMSFPVITEAVTAGFSQNNQKMLVMAQCYNFSKYEIFRYIKLPVCKPYFFSGADTVFGISWKVVAAAEVLCLPKYAAGALMQTAQIHLESSRVISLTITLVFFSFLLRQAVVFVYSRGKYGKK